MRKRMLVIVSLCGLVAHAVEPVAVWNGDFNTTTKGDYTLTANGNTVASDGSSITIVANATKGVKVSWPTGRGAETTIIKISGLVHSASKPQVLLAAGNGSNARVGVTWNTDQKAKGIWDGALWYNASYCQTQNTFTAPASGTMLMAMANSSSDGTYLYENTAGDWTLAYGANGLRANNDGSYFKGVSICGPETVNDTYTPAFGAVIEAIAIFDVKLTQADIAAYQFPTVVPPSEPVALFNLGYTRAETGWYNHAQNGGSDIGPLTTNAVSLAVTKNAGNFFYTTNEDFAEVNTDFADNGTYADIFGTNHATLQEEIKTSLGLKAVNFTSAVYKSGQMNGGQTDHAVSLAGLDANSKYVVYAGFGLLRTKYNEQVMGVQFDATGYGAADALEYVTTVAGQNATVTNAYQTFAAGSALKCGTQGLMVVRLKNVKPKTDGSIAFTLKGEKGGMNFLAVAKVNAALSDSTTIDITGTQSYADLDTTGFKKVTLNLTGNAELTFTQAVASDVTLTFTGAHDLTVKGAEHLVWANVTDAGVSGNLRYEFGGATAPAGLLAKIKTAGTKTTFAFVGSGTTVDLASTAANTTLNTHLVFKNGSHVFQYSNDNRKFGASATYASPTVLVESGTLTFKGHDVTGWSAGTDDKGIIRVMDGAKLQLENYGSGSFYYNQRIAIDAGATVEIGRSLNNNQFRMTEGVNGKQIWVQDCATDMTAKPAKLIMPNDGKLALAKDGAAQGIGVYVGANAKLQISGTITSLNDSHAQDNTLARMIQKTGAGELEISGTHGVTWDVAAGSIGGAATVKKMTLAEGASLVVKENKTITVETALTLPKPVYLIGAPVHGMAVITPPSGFDATDCTATLNGGSDKTYELYLADGALKLKYKTPPEFAEEIAPFKAEVKEGNGGKVTVNVAGLDLHDYANDVTYKLDFGGELVVDGAREGNVITFDLTTGGFAENMVYRGNFVVDFGDGTLKNPIAVYQGEQTYVAYDAWVNETPEIKGQSGTWNLPDAVTVSGGSLVVNAAEGVTFTPSNTVDYVAKCDSMFVVTLSASEAVDATADAAVADDVQGGVRLVKVDASTVKLQFLNGATWIDGVPEGDAPITAGLDETVSVTVAFHYAKDAEDRDTVKYTVGDYSVTCEKRANTADLISQVLVADGTRLAALLGSCQLDKAVVVDISIEPGETKALSAEDEAAAQAEADRMTIAITEAVAEVVKTAEQQASYRSYLKVFAVKGTDGKYHAVVDFTDNTAFRQDLEDDLAEAVKKVVEGFDSESGAAAFDGKPGLYYGLVRGHEPNALTITDEKVMADADGKVTISITKPAGATKHFYRIVCSPAK